MELKSQKKILFIVGTRPEAIKLCPLIKETSKFFDTYVIGTGQHHESVLEVFSLFDLKLNSIFPLKKFKNTVTQLAHYQKIISETIGHYSPDLVVVHGDTTSCLAGAVTAYFHKIDVAHIEAGLRTQNKYSPFPEEMFRKWTDAVAKYCYAPTINAKENLLKEGIDAANIVVSGNTVVDSLVEIIKKPMSVHDEELVQSIINKSKKVNQGYFLVTLHRNEIKNTHLKKLTIAIVEIAKKKNYAIIWPLHPNNVIKNTVVSQIKNQKHVYTLPPVNYALFLKMVENSSLIITDSGGIQEEATVLGKKILILRNETERPEVLTSSYSLMGGIEEKYLEEKMEYLLNLPKNTSKGDAIFGKGDASVKIVSHWKKVLK